MTGKDDWTVVVVFACHVRDRVVPFGSPDGVHVAGNDDGDGARDFKSISYAARRLLLLLLLLFWLLIMLFSLRRRWDVRA